MRNIIRTLAGAAAVASIVALGAGAAGASTPPQTTKNTTAQCRAALNCVTPDVLNSTDNVANDELALDAGTFRNARVWTRVKDGTSPRQDWEFIFHGTVGALFNEGVNPYGITSQDVATYGNDEVFQLRKTPFGSTSTDVCLSNTALKGVRLRHCALNANQNFIAASVVNTQPNPDSDGVWGLSLVPDVTSPAGHDALQGNGEDARVTIHDPQTINRQSWDAEDSPVSLLG